MAILHGSHSATYSRAVYARISRLGSKEDIESDLNKIAKELRAYDDRHKTVEDWA